MQTTELQVALDKNGLRHKALFSVLPSMSWSSSPHEGTYAGAQGGADPRGVKEVLARGLREHFEGRCASSSCIPHSSQIRSAHTRYTACT